MSYLTRNVVISSKSIPCSCLMQFSCVMLADLGYKLVVAVTRQVMYLEAGCWAYRLIRLLKLRPWTVKVSGRTSLFLQVGLPYLLGLQFFCYPITICGKCPWFMCDVNYGLLPTPAEDVVS